MKDLKNMKLMIDTNIVLDVLLKREPFFESSFKILELSERNDICEYISATSLTDIYYLANKQLHNKTLVLELINNLLKIVHIAGVNEQEIRLALNLGWKDFEDAVQYSSAKSVEADCIITRNPNDYIDSQITVYNPDQALNIL
ncbi:MAG: PIN domain-containing protein [Candidatus Riflebacteria bacterium]|nr:PIN domain-containing protein [Candidatus Riflebacteria bacterium]